MTLQELKAKYGDLQNQIDTVKAAAEKKPEGLTKADYESISALMDQQDELKAQIDTAGRMESRGDFVEGSTVEVHGLAADAAPYSLGEYVQDAVKIADANRKGQSVSVPRADAYQRRIKNAPTGNSEGVPSEGGFLVGTDMGSGIMKRVYENNQLLSGCTRRTISANANGIKINGLDETSRADGSRHGGVRGYWVAEGNDITASRPKWRRIELELKKVAALYYPTDELMSDAVALEQEVTEAVGDELSFKIQDAIYRGDGAGKPLGILNSPCLIEQAKETGQAADTVVFENILKMWTRKWGSGSNYAWIINDEIIPQLAVMNVAVGTGGVPVFLPAGGAAQAPFSTLFGRPIIEIEQASAIGDAGDIMLADMSQYLVAEKGGVQFAMSIHVQFVNDELVLRWIIRIDGQPTWNAALTRYKGANTKSPFVVLAAR